MGHASDTPLCDDSLPFKMKQRIEGGGMSQVYRARMRDTKQDVVVKFLGKSFVTNPQLVERFEREIAIMEVMEHDHIVRVFGDGWHKGFRYYYMERCSNGTVADVLTQHKNLTVKNALNVAIQVCLALEYIHGEGIVHRDIKPANLFVDRNGNVKLGDFGIAFFEGANRITDSGNSAGSCHYIAPEQISGSHSLTPRTDIYSLGCVLFEMLVGHPPFRSRTRYGLYRKHMAVNPPKLRSIDPQCPAELARLVDTMLRKSPSQRPASAKTIRRELECIKADLINRKNLRRRAPAAKSAAPAPQVPTKSPIPTSSTPTSVARPRPPFERTRPQTTSIKCETSRDSDASAAALQILQQCSGGVPISRMGNW